MVYNSNAPHIQAVSVSECKEMVREVFLFLIVIPAIFAVSVSVGDEGVVQIECGSNGNEIIEQLISYGSSITLNDVKTVCEGENLPAIVASSLNFFQFY